MIVFLGAVLFMKKLFIGFGVFLVLVASFVVYKSIKTEAKRKSVTLTEIEIRTVNETVSCNGYLSAKNSKGYKCGYPAEITYIAVDEGQEVSRGDILFSYRTLAPSELKLYLGDIVSGELQDQVGEFVDNTDETDILAAASYYSKTGKLPAGVSNFYLSGLESEPRRQSEKHMVFAEFSGTVTGIFDEKGEYVSGILNTVTVTDSNSLAAEVGIPEKYLGDVEIGQYALITAGGGAGPQVPSVVAEISGEAKTVGSLLGNSETVVECILDVEPGSEVLIPGLSVRADIFVNTWKDAAVIPYSALCSDGEGEYVWVYEDGTVVRTDIDSEYKFAKGVVVTGVFTGGELLVKDPDDGIYSGMAVSVSSEEK